MNLALWVSTLLAASVIASAQPDFAVASVRPNRAAITKGEGSEAEKITVTPSGLIMWNVTLRSAIRWAYGLRDYQIAAPGWLASERYDISAKASEGVPVQQLRLMLQRLLTERFQLSVRKEAKELPVLLMSLKKGADSRFTRAAEDGTPSMLPAGGALEFRNCSMAEFAERLGARPFKLDRLVLDRTGLEGDYDFRVALAADMTGLKHTLEGMEMGAAGAPSMVPILEEQLKVSFKAARAPVDSLIVERASKIPAGN